MFKRVHYNIGLSKIERILKFFDLFKSKSPRFQCDLSDMFKASALSQDYQEIYAVAVENFDYDFLLYDNSILQFSYSNVDDDSVYLRFNYIQNPQYFHTYEEYLNEFYPEFLDQQNDLDLIQDYEDFLSAQKLNSSAISIRYDCDKKGYFPLVHSYSHLHIGQWNSIRIPLDKFMSPSAFTYFVVQSVYPSKWRIHCNSDSEKYEEILREMKFSCPILEDALFSSEEKKQFYMT